VNQATSFTESEKSQATAIRINCWTRFTLQHEEAEIGFARADASASRFAISVEGLVSVIGHKERAGPLRLRPGLRAHLVVHPGQLALFAAPLLLVAVRSVWGQPEDGGRDRLAHLRGFGSDDRLAGVASGERARRPRDRLHPNLRQLSGARARRLSSLSDRAQRLDGVASSDAHPGAALARARGHRSGSGRRGRHLYQRRL